MSDFSPRAGALRYLDNDGKYIAANPHDLLFSTVTMLATEFWDGYAWRSNTVVEKPDNIVTVTVHVGQADDPQYYWDNATVGEGFAWHAAYMSAVREQALIEHYEYLVTGRRS
jgi:hypothetical protein